MCATAGPKKQKARQTVALAQKKERVPPLLIGAVVAARRNPAGSGIRCDRDDGLGLEGR